MSDSLYAYLGIGFIIGIVVLLAVLFALIIALDASDPGPQQVFESHLLALDEERLNDALTYVEVAACGMDMVANAPQAAIDLESRGYSFSTAFMVEEVWILEDGSRALLGLRTPPSMTLPSVVQLVRSDGKWLLTCG